GRCGGGDFQHVTPAAQRELKAAVVREQLTRLAGLSVAEVEDLGVRVAELPGGPLGWRTRVRYTVDAAGRAGLLAHRSHEVVPVDRCLIAHPAIRDLPVTSTGWPVDNQVGTVASGTGEVAVYGDRSGPVSGPATVRERALGRDWRGERGGFWQVHPAAADTLAGADRGRRRGRAHHRGRRSARGGLRLLRSGVVRPRRRGVPRGRMATGRTTGLRRLPDDQPC